MTEQEDMQARAVGELGATKEYAKTHVKVAGFMVENVQWTRLRKRVGHAETEHAPEWLLGLATLAAGVAASAIIAYAALPNATTTPRGATDSGVSAGTRPTLIAAFVAGLVLAVAFGVMYGKERRKHRDERSDIQDEMDTIKRAWEEASTPQGSDMARAAPLAGGASEAAASATFSRDLR